MAQIKSDGSTPATITAYVRDTNNNFVTGAPVVFAATSGGLGSITSATDKNGAATALLSTAGDPSVRTITVTVTSGAIKQTIQVGVIGTTLSFSGPSALILSKQGTYSVALKDAGGNPIANQAVALTSALGNTLSSSTVTTDSSGSKTFTVTGAAAGADTITATALGVTSQSNLAVSNQNFAFTAPTAALKVNVNATQTVAIAWSTGASPGTPQANQPITFSATRGTLSTNQTNTLADGTATVTISSSTAGPSVITAQGAGVSTSVEIDFIATTPAKLNLQASPATIATQGQTTLTATVRDDNDNLVEGQSVSFNITKDSSGGSLSTNPATTNAQGQASTVYTATPATSGTNGVQVTASVIGTPAVGSTTLTVASKTISLVIGTGNTVITPTATQYSVDYTVQAIDSSGNAVNGVPITFTVVPVNYFKGFWTFGTKWTQTITAGACPNEDINFNGILDAGEDKNNDGKLEPGFVASAVGPAQTAGNGSADVIITYPRDHAQWVTVMLTATATVNGTENTQSTTFLLPILAADIATNPPIPPGINSPYGTSNTCADSK